MSNREKLNDLLADVFLLEPDELRDDMRREELTSWDSLGAVSLAVGVEEVFGYHMSPEQAVSLESIGDIVVLLESNGVPVGA